MSGPLGDFETSISSEISMRLSIFVVTCFLVWFAEFTSPRGAMAEESIQQSPAGIACSRAGNDDTVRPFEPALRSGFLKAYKLLFPDKPDEAELKTGYFRCKGGHLLACFAGANLPCGKLDTSKNNQGAIAFCRQNPKADTVPMSATGHDTIYFFACSNGRAKIKKQNWKVDRRGFGIDLWKAMD
jgi:hypothetical protein